MTGHCSNCGKIWTLETRQGVCSWCGKLATCQNQRTQALRSLKSSSKRSKRQAQSNGNGYDQLDGEWLTYYKVAQAYVGKVPTQDRDDVRHDIMLELNRATNRDGKPLPTLRAYRIASLMVAGYWRDRLKREVKVCVYNGVATDPNCASCRHKPKGKRCPYQATRPIQSLDQPTTDYDGYECRLLDTVADDNAIDLDAWLDDKTFIRGCPMRLIEIATKKKNGEPLSWKDHKYWEREIKKTQKALF